MSNVTEDMPYPQKEEKRSKPQIKASLKPSRANTKSCSSRPGI